MQTDMMPDAAVEAAARWLANSQDRTGQRIVPELKIRFGLTAHEAVQAIREANRLRGGADANL